MFILQIFYLVGLICLFFDNKIFFFDAEFLIGFCMIILFICLFSAIRKLIALNFFSKTIYLYYVFLYLLNLNVKLIDKVILFLDNYSFFNNFLWLNTIRCIFYDSLFLITNRVVFSTLLFLDNFVLFFINNIFVSFNISYPLSINLLNDKSKILYNALTLSEFSIFKRNLILKLS